MHRNVLKCSGAAVLLSLFLVVVLAPCARSADTNFKLEHNGVVRSGKMHFDLVYFAKGWKMSGNYSLKKIKQNGYAKDSITLSATLPVTGGEFSYTQTFKSPQPNRAEISYALKGKKEQQAELVAIALKIPIEKYATQIIKLGNKEIKLPEEFGTVNLATEKNVSAITIPTSKGNLVIRGNKMLCVLQDDRKFNATTFSLRILIPGTKSASIKDASLSLSLSLVPYRLQMADIRKACNVGFADEVASDGKGGWTDQGKGNDLGMINPGKLKCSGLEFDILDPATNGGKSCMVFAGPQRDYFLKNAQISIDTHGETLPWLYLLHSSAWTPEKGESLGTVEAVYDDGSVSRHQIKSRIDVGDWWSGNRHENADIAWTGQNASSSVALYVSPIKLWGKPVKTLKFTGSGKGVWMVVGATLSSGRLPRPRDIPLQITESNDWKPFHCERKIIPGSIMDFSFLNDAPAGKYGNVVVRNGQFEFSAKPGKRVKFIGANLCFSANFLPDAQADNLATQFKLMGYNSVRMHHFDRSILKGGWSSTSSNDIDPKLLDRIDYLFAAMKKAGMYILIDLYVARVFDKTEVEGWGKPVGREIKALVPVHEGAFKAWSMFSLKLLNHVNPYTGIAWKDDPALMGICPVNEDSILAEWSKNGDVKKLYMQKFDQWLKEKNIPQDSADKDKLLAQFLLEVKMESNQKLEKYLHENGVRALITGSNYLSRKWQTFTRNQFDFVDNHCYWDHPKFSSKAWKLPYSFKQQSSIKHFAELPRRLMPSRIMGKPFAVTEYNFTPPNIYRAEGGALMGSYSALQDWDALYRFAWSHSDTNILEQRAVRGFDASTDPLSILTEKLITLLFQRGDVSPAQKSYVYGVDMEDATRGGAGWGAGYFSKDFTRTGLISRIGSAVVQNGDPLKGNFTGVSAAKNLPESLLDGNKFIPLDKLPGSGNSKIFTSDTGQVSMDSSAGSMKVITPKTECFVLPKGKSAQGDALSSGSANEFCSLSASAMDGKTLFESGKILLLHLSNLENSGIQFADQQMHTLRNWGKLPYLVRNCTVEVKLKSANPSLEVWAINLSGKRLDKVTSTYKDGVLSFRAETTPEKGPTRLAYEITAAR